ncbi:MAG: HAD family hydrolase [Bacteroidales bacterium]|nr:HAD family hydrolase [Bacteroidales bacterium]
MNTRLVIFDLDGTLVDTLADLAAAMNTVLSRLGYPTHPVADYRFKVGNGVAKLVERSLPEAARQQPAVVADALQQFLDYYNRHDMDATAPYDGIPDLLKRLKARGLQLAVASNKPHAAAVEIVHHYFGQDLFDCIYGQRPGAPVKPDPAIVHDILRTLDVSAGHALYVGDSAVDMETARRSGIPSVGVLWGFRPESELREAGACHIVSHPSEIFRIFAG